MGLFSENLKISWQSQSLKALKKTRASLSSKFSSWILEEVIEYCNSSFFFNWKILSEYFEKNIYACIAFVLIQTITLIRNFMSNFPNIKSINFPNIFTVSLKAHCMMRISAGKKKFAWRIFLPNNFLNLFIWNH